MGFNPGSERIIGFRIISNDKIKFLPQNSQCKNEDGS